MAKVWSFNTTIRNPERVEALLRILSEMEGVTFDEQGQEKFFGLQIKKRFYVPTRATLGEELASAVYDSDQTEDLDENTVKRILARYTGDVNAAARGRTAVAVLNRFGLCIALQSHGPVVITPLGRKWLSGEIDDEQLFTRFLLRWQYPNPIEDGYAGFDIKPFVAVINLISGVNKKISEYGNEPVGLSMDEYRLFALSLKTSSDINRAVSEILNSRQRAKSLSGRDRADFVNNFFRSKVISIFGYTNEDNLRKQIANLKDYADSSLRYFRITGLISVRGNGHYVDIAADKSAEAKSVIDTVSLPATHFSTEEDYLNYLGDLSGDLPWQNEVDMRKISENLSFVLKTEAREANVAVDKVSISGESVAIQIEFLQKKLNDVRLHKLRSLRHNVDALDEAIAKLSTITNPHYEVVTTRPSLDLEWFVSRALLVLNDALSIQPSFKIGDDGLPTGFRSKISDIECVYDTFGLTVEVTLEAGRNQWYAEGQPVMRHLRDFEDKLGEKKASCIFIAPCIHRDTLNQYWTSNKYEYEGERQVIIPLTISEFVEFLKKSLEKIYAGTLDHSTIRNFINGVAATVDEYTSSAEWRDNIKSLVETW
jgi:hypothetical protein